MSLPRTHRYTYSNTQDYTNVNCDAAIHHDCNANTDPATNNPAHNPVFVIWRQLRWWGMLRAYPNSHTSHTHASSDPSSSNLNPVNATSAEDGSEATIDST